jgi:hypothetical protein
VSFFLFQVEWETNLGARKKGWHFLLEKICSVGSLFYLRGVDTKWEETHTRDLYFLRANESSSSLLL